MRYGDVKNVFKDMITIPKMGIGIYRVWYRDFFYFKKYFLVSLFWNFTEPILYVVAFGYGLGFFVGQIDGVPYVTFLAPAILATTAMQGAAFESTYSSYTKLKMQKTYETIMMTPISIDEIVIGEILWGASKAFFSSIAVLVVFTVLGLAKNGTVWLALPVLALLSLAISAISMVATGFANDYDSFTYYFALFITPMSFLSGTFFPLSQFPHWAQVVAKLFPLSHGVQVIRGLYLGQWDASLLLNILALLLISFLFTNWAVAQIRRRLVY
jgi:lipooligosaccharide transport system permease protein